MDTLSTTNLYLDDKYGYMFNYALRIEVHTYDLEEIPPLYTNMCDDEIICDCLRIKSENGSARGK